MTKDRNEQRRQQIEVAALELLAEKGYRSTSMLQIAKKASASNQTLYAWYGNKQELFRGIIEENGRAIRTLLQDVQSGHGDPLEALKALGPHLLRFTTGQKAIIMNRAAIADVSETGRLASAIEEVARSQIFGLISDLMADLDSSGVFRLDKGGQDAAASYISLLFGEIRMRQALGALDALTEEEIAAQADRAFDLTCRLYKI